MLVVDGIDMREFRKGGRIGTDYYLERDFGDIVYVFGRKGVG